MLLKSSQQLKRNLRHVHLNCLLMALQHIPMLDCSQVADLVSLRKRVSELLHVLVATQVRCLAPAVMVLTVVAVAMLVGTAVLQVTAATLQR